MRIEHVSSEGLTVAWEASVNWFGSYRLYRVVGETYTFVDEVDSDKTSFVIDEVEEDEDYVYAVETVWDDDGDEQTDPVVSERVASDSVTIPQGVPARPSDLIVTANGAHAMNLSWTNNSAIADGGFLIQRKNDEDGWDTIDATLEQETTYTDNSVYSASAYSYRIIALGTEFAASQGGGGGSGSSTPESEPSDEEIAVTEYGDGIVYMGTPNVDEIVRDGVSVAWDGINSPNRNDAVTISIENLPEHYGLYLSVEGGITNENWDDPDLDTVTLELAEESDFVSTGGDITPFGLEVYADTEEDSASFTITGSDFEGLEGDGWGVSRVIVKLLRYRPSFSLPILTVQREEEEPVPVTVLKEDGSEASDVDLSVAKEKNLQASVEEGEDGPVLNLTGGAKLGAAMLVLQVAGGGQAAAGTTVGPYAVSIVDEYNNGPGVNNVGYQYPTFGVGQTWEWNVYVTDANGAALDTQNDAAPTARVLPGGSDLSTSFRASNIPGVWILAVTCNFESKPHPLITPFFTRVEITYPTNPASVPPALVFVYTSTYTVKVRAPLGFGVPDGTPIPLDAWVTDPAGNGVEGVTVQSKRWLGPIVIQPASAVTNAAGKARFWASTSHPWLMGETYRVDFTIGSGKNPQDRATAIGEVYSIGP